MTTKNPYDKKNQETQYNNWEHGFNSLRKEDCPYTPDMLEYDDCFPIWMEGFNAGKKKDRRKPSEDSQGSNKVQEGETPQLSNYGEQELLEELKKRKKKQYETLLKKKAEIEAELAKWKFLFEI